MAGAEEMHEIKFNFLGLRFWKRNFEVECDSRDFSLTWAEFINKYRPLLGKAISANPGCNLAIKRNNAPLVTQIWTLQDKVEDFVRSYVQSRKSMAVFFTDQSGSSQNVFKVPPPPQPRNTSTPGCSTWDSTGFHPPARTPDVRNPSKRTAHEAFRDDSQPPRFSLIRECARNVNYADDKDEDEDWDSDNESDIFSEDDDDDERDPTWKANNQRYYNDNEAPEINPPSTPLGTSACTNVTFIGMKTEEDIEDYVKTVKINVVKHVTRNAAVRMRKEFQSLIRNSRRSNKYRERLVKPYFPRVFNCLRRVFYGLTKSKLQAEAMKLTRDDDECSVANSVFSQDSSSDVTGWVLAPAIQKTAKDIVHRNFLTFFSTEKAEVAGMQREIITGSENGKLLSLSRVLPTISLVFNNIFTTGMRKFEAEITRLEEQNKRLSERIKELNTFWKQSVDEKNKIEKECSLKIREARQNWNAGETKNEEVPTGEEKQKKPDSKTKLKAKKDKLRKKYEKLKEDFKNFKKMQKLAKSEFQLITERIFGYNIKIKDFEDVLEEEGHRISINLTSKLSGNKDNESIRIEKKGEELRITNYPQRFKHTFKTYKRYRDMIPTFVAGVSTSYSAVNCSNGGSRYGRDYRRGSPTPSRDYRSSSRDCRSSTRDFGSLNRDNRSTNGDPWSPIRNSHRERSVSPDYSEMSYNSSVREDSSGNSRRASVDRESCSHEVITLESSSDSDTDYDETESNYAGPTEQR